ncbi:hypothetical protein P8818_16640 [Bacillus velezensis]|uniref:hypothetical protein n=1 Tax=Bacillus subtilis group TaxID=653685 RepID=UPI001EEB6826|nr:MULTISPECIES: hypothetical protein [Bacillus subtilis group]MCT6515543.1 hypothetical protein [Bacillus subtilis]MEC0383793.1 hypothetical protein [Bacillus velezensis]MEC0389181.1 hypothetical protein [Bacillus velezensis]WBY48011.1 hypothetical protein PF996_21550 [Bacillus velezensis]WRU08165.1 hypothetical protein VDS58_23455 [Bacillus subtilis]
MKRIITSVMLLGVLLLSGCGKEKCEDTESCKRALEYVTYDNQNAYDKMYSMEIGGNGGKTSSSLEDAKSKLPDDYENVKEKSVEKYAAIEYEIKPGSEYIYKFVFFDLRSNEKKVTSVKMEKVKNQYLAKQIFGSIKAGSIEKENEELITPKYYFSDSLTEKEKDELKPTPVKKDE